MTNAGFEVSTATVDISSRESIHAVVETATKLGDVTGVIHAAGVSPSQASPATILAVDLFGTAVLLEEFGNVIARGGSGVVIASQSGHRLGALTPLASNATVEEDGRMNTLAGMVRSMLSYGWLRATVRAIGTPCIVAAVLVSRER